MAAFVAAFFVGGCAQKPSPGAAALSKVGRAVPVAERMPCGDRDDFINHLKRKYGEALVGHGLTAGGVLIELLVNRATGTWSILMTGANMPTCMTSSGDGWRSRQPDPDGPAA